MPFMRPTLPAEHLERCLFSNQSEIFFLVTSICSAANTYRDSLSA